jgi:hypothetical protein
VSDLLFGTIFWKTGFARASSRLHTRAVLVSTFVLLTAGTVGFLLLENNVAFSSMNTGKPFSFGFFPLCHTENRRL